MSELRSRIHPAPRAPRAPRARRRPLACLAAFAALAGLAPAAEAATTRLTYSCTYPYIGAQPLTLDLEASPAPVDAGIPGGSFPVTGTATDNGVFSAFMEVLAAEQLSATSVLKTKVASPSLNLDINVRLATPLTVAPAGTAPSSWPVSGSVPSMALMAGTASFSALTLNMNLALRYGDGEPVTVPQRVPETDTDPDTFDVPCKLSPVDQPATYATREIRPAADTIAPTRPGTPVASEITDTSARLTWARSTDTFGVTAYDVYRGATKVTSVTGTTAVVTGLGRGTTSLFTVVARDAAGNQSAASTAVAVTTLLVRPPLKLTLSCRFPVIGNQPASITIDAGIASVQRAGVLTGAFTVQSTIVVSPQFNALAEALEAATIEGRGTSAWILQSTGALRRLTTPIGFAQTPFPLSANTLNGVTNMPSLMFRQPGPGSITVDSLNLVLTARYADGTPVLGLSSGWGIPDTDGDPQTFDVPCTFDPSTQNRVLVPLSIQ